MQPVAVIEFKIEHYDEVLGLMRRTPGVTVRDADSQEATVRYLERNPGFSFVAQSAGRIIGCVMCGHDGRRGYLQHVLVEPERRGQGIANDLVARCLDALEKVGILKTHIDVLVNNELANQYWTRRGWTRRDDVFRYSFNRSSNRNA